MKLLILSAALASSSLQVKWDKLSIGLSARGELNTEEKYWTGGLTECDTQCKQAGGNVCGKS